MGKKGKNTVTVDNQDLTIDYTQLSINDESSLTEETKQPVHSFYIEFHKELKEQLGSVEYEKAIKDPYFDPLLYMKSVPEKVKTFDKDGLPQVEYTGNKVNVYDLIQEENKVVQMNNQIALQGASRDDWKDLSYFDTTPLKKGLLENAYEQKNALMTFNALPLSIKERFDNSFEKFVREFPKEYAKDYEKRQLEIQAQQQFILDQQQQKQTDPGKDKK